MKIAIFGLGYVGFTAACCIARDGHQVLGIDVHSPKAELINSGVAPFTEPGLSELLKGALAAGNIEAIIDPRGRMDGIELVLVCVGTPSDGDGSHDMTYIASVSHQIAMALAEREHATPVTVVYRSTMRPGSCDSLIGPIFDRSLTKEQRATVQIAYNPEFLREGTAIADYDAPPKIVIGTEDGRECAPLKALYAHLDAPLFEVGLREAEITKFVDNSFHALKVAFANEIGRVCIKEGVDVEAVHDIFIADTKLNISPYYLRPGGPFGGSCLPKDVRALNYMAEDIGAQTHVIHSIVRSNEAHKLFQFERATNGLKPGARVLLNGLAFKRATDDLRESPYLDLARRIMVAGFDLAIRDPNVSPDKLTGSNLGYSFSHLPGLSGLMMSTFEGEKFDRVLDARGDAESLGVDAPEIISINRL